MIVVFVGFKLGSSVNIFIYFSYQKSDAVVILHYLKAWDLSLEIEIGMIISVTIAYKTKLSRHSQMKGAHEIKDLCKSI